MNEPNKEPSCRPIAGEGLAVHGGCTRRDLLCGSARYAALAGIALISGGLLLRRGKAPAASRCSQPLECRRCALLRHCDLPEAAAARRGEEDDHV